MTRQDMLQDICEDAYPEAIAEFLPPNDNPHYVYYLDEPERGSGWYFNLGHQDRFGPWATKQIASAMASTFWAGVDSLIRVEQVWQ